MNWSHVLKIALVVVIIVAVLLVGFLAGRKWRREYKAALDQWQQLSSRAASSATSSAQASGNVVSVHVDSGREFESGSRGLWFPSAVRAGLDSGAPTGTETLGDGDVNVLPSIGVGRSTRLSRLLFGSGRVSVRGDVGSESSARGS